MPRTPCPQLAQQWHDRLLRFERSQLTVADFCQREGYSVPSFYSWKRKLADASNQGPLSSFVPVDLPPQSFLRQSDDGTQGDFDLRVELPGGALLRLDADASDEQQQRLIRNVIRSVKEVVR